MLAAARGASYHTDVQRAVVDWWIEHQRRDLPWRSPHVTAATYHSKRYDPYHIWVSEVMSQQTQLGTVVRYYAAWMSHFPTIEALAAASEAEVRAVWAGMGYYRRAMYLREGARYLTERHAQQQQRGAAVGMPRSVAELLKIPGIGPYTAAAIASVCYHEPVIAVDGNVVRVLSRLRAERDVDPKKPASIKRAGEWGQELMTAGGAAPCTAPGALNQGLMELGASICRPAGAPLCGECPLKAYCGARAALLDGEITAIEGVIPLRAASSKKRVEEVVCVVHEFAGRRYAVVRRPEGGLLGGMLELPSLGHTGGATAAAAVQALRGGAAAAPRRVGQLKHVFSHIDMLVDVYHVRWPDGAEEARVCGALAAQLQAPAGAAASQPPPRSEEAKPGLARRKGTPKKTAAAATATATEEAPPPRVFVKSEAELQALAASRLLWKELHLLPDRKKQGRVTKKKTAAAAPKRSRSTAD
ncbi:A/G-specific adenine glycosylase [Strigomonas culicis]|uniref:Adenine DNA glycosylase n=1 Tax=Strigomonas culicis TaxID=28005 RepID=S9V3V4_9TRYP|nr:A/G-specific adenine glycosylase [Strigomonas culicis]|eukprot:EPY35724.1 A/G-specific adenine glycosylase [Strigomonas culicis]